MTGILVVGANGQVGRELLRADWTEGHDIVGIDIDELDITDEASVQAVLNELAPDVVVNAAAYTAVDAAQDAAEVAMAVNSTAVGHLARASSDIDARLVHISTDYVFDGTKAGWYTEDDPASPLGVYGETKWAGEREAQAYDGAIVLRTAWVYGALGNNFVRTMLQLGSSRDELSVVADQVGCPTAAIDIAASIVKIVGSWDQANHQLYHLASPEPASWFQFARAVLASEIDSGQLDLRPLTTSQYPTLAARPANSRLDCSRLFSDFGLTLPRWSDTLPGVVVELRQQLSAED